MDLCASGWSCLAIRRRTVQVDELLLSNLLFGILGGSLTIDHRWDRQRYCQCMVLSSRSASIKKAFLRLNDPALPTSSSFPISTERLFLAPALHQFGSKAQPHSCSRTTISMTGYFVSSTDQAGPPGSTTTSPSYGVEITVR